MDKERVAILGGGPSGLTTAYWLSSTDELRAKYDVTVYQMGWRLGGKGASGRNQEHGDRIEEHGLHILFGFYQNFFSMIRDVYGSLERPPDAPLATWREAFHPHSFGVVEDEFNELWEPWGVVFPRNREVPGTGVAVNGVVDYTSMFLQVVIDLLLGMPALEQLQQSRYTTGKSWEESAARGSHSKHRPVWAAMVLLQFASSIARDMTILAERRLPLLVRLLEQFRNVTWSALAPLMARKAGAHKLWTAVDFLISVAVGVVRDGVFEEGGCTAIDGYDFREWLTKHGAHEQTVHSPFARAIYDAAFSYDDGNPNRQLLSAGVAMRTMARMGLTYKGAMYFKMQAGMGDTVFGPMYQALQDRGVKFAFFHKVASVHPDADHTHIERVVVDQQVDLTSGDPYSYEPLYDVKGLPCWPSQPLWEQIEDSDRVRHIDLESYYSGYDGVGQRTLEHGKDFDRVVLATPVQTLPFLCREILDHSDRWQQMVDNVEAVQTVSLQVWFKEDLASLGWEMPSPLLSVFVEPLNTWADMSQVLDKENWHDVDPKQVSYFTGAQPGPAQPPPATEQKFPAEMTAKAKEIGFTYLEQSLTTLLPDAENPDRPPALNWDLVVDPEHRVGIERYEAQYWRSNSGPSERCTLALPGTQQYRMRADDTGYHNLFVSGDWIDNGFYVACMEGAIMAGIHTARAVTGIEFPIIGEELDKRFS